MTLMIELTPEMEERFRAGIANHDAVQVRQVLAKAVDDLIESMMPAQQPALTPDEWEREADELLAYVDSILPDDVPILSDYAISREGIYGDHP